MLDYKEYKRQKEQEKQHIFGNFEIDQMILIYLDNYIKDYVFDHTKECSVDFIEGMKNILNHLVSINDINGFNKNNRED